jgi:uncharacterized protein
VTTLHRTGLLFLPRGWQRAHALRWLKRVHAWTGFWGALLFLLLGTSGFLLNHRDTLKIDTGEPVEVSAMEIAVPAGSLKDEKALGRWAQAELCLTSEPRPPRGGGEGPRGKRFLGKERPQAQKWELNFNHPNGRVTVEHVAGSGSVSVRQASPNLLGFLKNLHKGTGVGVAWVLFMDTIAGALLAMAVTGFLLWSHLHGPRLLAGIILLASTGLATLALWPALL